MYDCIFYIFNVTCINDGWGLRVSFFGQRVGSDQASIPSPVAVMKEHISVSGIVQIVIASAIGLGINFIADSIKELTKATVELSTHSLALQTQVNKLDQSAERLEERLRLVERQMAAFEYREKKAR